MKKIFAADVLADSFMISVIGNMFDRYIKEQKCAVEVCIVVHLQCLNARGSIWSP